MRCAKLRSEVESANVVAAALRPDDTDEIETRVEDGRLEATIERETTPGLQSTIDDYVVNLGVALDVIDQANSTTDTEPTDTNTTRP